MSQYENQTIDGNFMLVFGFEDVSAGYTAFAGICQISETTQRPLVGYIVINIRNTILEDKSFTEKIYTTLVHEAHHSIGFLSGFLNRFYDRTT